MAAPMALIAFAGLLVVVTAALLRNADAKRALAPVRSTLDRRHDHRHGTRSIAAILGGRKRMNISRTAGWSHGSTATAASRDELRLAVRAVLVHTTQHWPGGEYCSND